MSYELGKLEACQQRLCGAINAYFDGYKTNIMAHLSGCNDLTQDIAAYCVKKQILPGFSLWSHETEERLAVFGKQRGLEAKSVDGVHPPIRKVNNFIKHAERDAVKCINISDELVTLYLTATCIDFLTLYKALEDAQQLVSVSKSLQDQYKESAFCSERVKAAYLASVFLMWVEHCDNKAGNPLQDMGDFASVIRNREALGFINGYCDAAFEENQRFLRKTYPDTAKIIASPYHGGSLELGSVYAAEDKDDYDWMDVARITSFQIQAHFERYKQALNTHFAPRRVEVSALFSASNDNDDVSVDVLAHEN